MESFTSVRIDKWMWAVRLFKSRTLASAACQAGRVQIAGQPVKPSREVHLNELIAVQVGRVHRIVRVAGLLDHRTSAKLVPNFLEDQTPPEEYARAKEEAERERSLFPKGVAKPSKHERRRIRQLFELEN